MVNIVEPFEKLLTTAFNSIMDYAFNYMFGVIAIIFWIRFVSTLLRGRLSIISLVIAIISTSMAITAGQDIWNNIPLFNAFNGTTNT